MYLPSSTIMMDEKAATASYDNMANGQLVHSEFGSNYSDGDVLQPISQRNAVLAASSSSAAAAAATALRSVAEVEDENENKDENENENENDDDDDDKDEDHLPRPSFAWTLSQNDENGDYRRRSSTNFFDGKVLLLGTTMEGQSEDGFIEFANDEAVYDNNFDFSKGKPVRSNPLISVGEAAQAEEPLYDQGASAPATEPLYDDGAADANAGDDVDDGGNNNDAAHNEPVYDQGDMRHAEPEAVYDQGTPSNEGEDTAEALYDRGAADLY